MEGESTQFANQAYFTAHIVFTQMDGDRKNHIYTTPASPSESRYLAREKLASVSELRG